MTIEALVIHLARAAARKPHVERLKAELPLPVTIVDAVDAAKLSEAELVAPMCGGCTTRPISCR